MCGICAAARAGGVEQGIVDPMLERLHHRGPEQSGVQRMPDCELGHARLSIIDIECGTQPMWDVAGRYSITYNGEVYNYRELHAELVAAGKQFHTHSDTEVTLVAYMHWGFECLQKFRGMFAFVIWDSQERTLFAARDLCGEKPLFHTTTPNGTLLLASEIKALVAVPAVARRLDSAAIDAYLALGYVPPDRTVYADIKPVPPASFLEWKDGEYKITKYWLPDFRTSAMSLSDASDRLRELAVQAVGRQMVADVTVGAFLSGGLDSSTIVALMQNCSADPIKTFSVGFGRYINELPYARAVADLYKTDHYEIDLGTPEVGSLLEQMADIYDEPFADSSNIPTYLIAKFARQHVKVVLSGDGGDELFGGYARYVPLALSQRVPSSLALWAVLRIASKVLRERNSRLHALSVAIGVRSRWSDMWYRAMGMQVNIPEKRRQEFWGDRQHIEPVLSGSDYLPATEITGLNRALHFDFTQYLPGDILVKVDRAAMANSLETRAPFLDRDLMEFALSLPENLKVRGGETKVVLKEACSRYWPQDLRSRTKQGFGAPYIDWLARSDVRAQVERVFAPDARLRDLLPGLPRGVPSGGGFTTWTLLTLGLWLEHNPSAS